MKDHTHAATENGDIAEPGGHMSNQQRKNDTDSATTGLKRRRLLKGAALAPAIFTLHSGSARAMLSSYQCIQKTVEKPKHPFKARRDDKWHNVPVKSEVIKVEEASLPTGSSRPIILIRKNAVQCYDISGDDRWTDTGKMDSELRRLFTAPDMKEYREMLLVNIPRVYARVYVDNEGHMVRVGPGSSGTAIGDSCWTSFT